MAKAPANMAKSVKDRLLNIARKECRAFDVLLVRFALERLLYRLSISAHRDRFVLKGGMLVTVWLADDNRVTRDADFLGHGDADPARLIADFGEIMAIESDDGLVFDINAPLQQSFEKKWNMAAFVSRLQPISKGSASPLQSTSASETLWPMRRSGSTIQPR